jgi:predicted nucleotidyltransferase
MRYISLMIRKIAVERLRDYEAELRKLGVESISLFGSVARGEESEASDIDAAVKLNPARAPRGFAYFGLLDDLEQRLEKVPGRRVDAVPEPEKKAPMQHEIDRDRIVAF